MDRRCWCNIRMDNIGRTDKGNTKCSSHCHGGGIKSCSHIIQPNYVVLMLYSPVNNYSVMLGQFPVFLGFVWFDSLRPINNLLVIKGRVFLGWTSTKLGLMFLLKDTTQWRRWGLNPRPFSLESSTLPLSHCAPLFSWVDPVLSRRYSVLMKDSLSPSIPSLTLYTNLATPLK